MVKAERTKQSRLTLKKVTSDLATAFALVLRRGGLLSWLTMIFAFAVSALTAFEIWMIRSAAAQVSERTVSVGILVVLGVTLAINRILKSANRELRWPLSERIERSVLEEVLKVAATCSYADFESPEFRDDLARSTNCASNNLWSAVWSLISLMTATMTIVGLLVVTWRISHRITVLVIVASVVLIAVGALKSRFEYGFAYHYTAADRERRYLADALTSLSEGKEMRLNGTAGIVLERHNSLFGDRIDGLKLLVTRRVVYDAFGSVAAAATAAVSFGFLSVQVRNGHMEVADAAAGSVAVYALATQIQAAANSVSSLLSDSLHIGDLVSFMARDSDELQLSAPVGPETIRLSGVSFTYPGKTVEAVRDVSTSIGAGEFVSIVGANGSGKSTLLKLTSGLYTPSAGRIDLVSQNGEEPVEGPISNRAAAVFQDYAEYELSASENVTIGAKTAVDETRLQSSLDAVGLSDFLANLPKGTETRLGRRFASGVALSSGQWQRLAIARCLYANTPIVLLDEPTSSSDPEFEAGFFGNLREYLPSQTIVLVSHRFSSVKHSDRILVMSEGELVEEGSHEELLDLSGGLYAAMFQLQSERILGSELESGN